MISSGHARSACQATIIVGLQYGDEGKARFVDMLAAEHDVVARFNGGANAGHTIVANGHRLALKQVPSGVLYPDKQLYIGSGCVVTPTKLKAEICELEAVGLSVTHRLKIHPQTTIVQPHHILRDQLQGGKVGTTKNGIGPAYANLCLRMDDERLLTLAIAELVNNPDNARQIMTANWQAAINQLGLNPADHQELHQQIDQTLALTDWLKPLVAEDPLYLQKLVHNQGKKVLLEGAQSVMLDLLNQPYCTSSRTLAPAALLGADLNLKTQVYTIGIAKAIMSRVGHGYFISEFGGAESEAYCMSKNSDGSPKYGHEVEAQLDHEQLLADPDPQQMSKAIRYYSGEYGTISTRPRRIGAFDLVQLNYACQRNGIDEILITKCDLLNLYARTAQKQIPVVVGYKRSGQEVSHYPVTNSQYAGIQPQIEYLPASGQELGALEEASQLPAEIKDFISLVSQQTGLPVTGIGIGPDRDQFINLTN